MENCKNLIENYWKFCLNICNCRTLKQKEQANVIASYCFFFFKDSLFFIKDYKKMKDISSYLCLDKVDIVRISSSSRR